MDLPFSIDQFLKVFEDYNNQFWPLQIVFNLAGILCIALTFRQRTFASQVVIFILSFFWFWMGIVYHMLYFSEINKLAVYFGAAFIFQGILFLFYGFQSQPVLTFGLSNFKLTGLFVILFALIIYPIIGYFNGHRFPISPSFGVPCPTTIFTFGILFLSDKKIPFVLVVIPLLWSIIGFTAAFKLGFKEDIGLILTAILFLVFHFRVKRKSESKINFQLR